MQIIVYTPHTVCAYGIDLLSLLVKLGRDKTKQLSSNACWAVGGATPAQFKGFGKEGSSRINTSTAHHEASLFAAPAQRVDLTWEPS